MLTPLLFIFAIIGLVDASYIFYKKHKKQNLICVIGEHTCDAVVNSKYNKIFGIPNEVLGILYYLFVILMAFIGSNTTIFMQLAASAALLGSIVLTIIQWKVLKIWCEYCLLSALMNLGIFVVVMVMVRGWLLS